jgi:hypothetical protein
MKIEYDFGENGIEHKDIFKHGCFGDKKIDFSYRVIESSWEENEDGTMTRTIHKAEPIDVTIVNEGNREIH